MKTLLVGTNYRGGEMYDTNYESTYYTSSSADPAVLMGMLAFMGVFFVIAYAVCAFFLGMIFKKAGVPQWKAWVPFVNGWAFFELGGQKGWISLLALLGWIPLVGFVASIVVLVFSIMAAIKVGEGFGKEGVFVLLYVFLPLVWLIWLAVEKDAVWKGAPAPAKVAASASQPPTTPSES